MPRNAVWNPHSAGGIASARGAVPEPRDELGPEMLMELALAIRRWWGNLPAPARAAVAGLLCTLPFLHTVGFGFIENWDDDRYILLNPWLGDLSPSKVIGVFAQPYFFNYHPLTMLSYQIEHALWGPWAPGYRMVNLLLHAACGGLLFAWLTRAGASQAAALLAVALFGFHPLRVEAVVWISERKELLCALFYLAAVHVWTADDPRPGPRRMALAAALTAASLMSKAMAVSLPATLLLYDLLLRRDALRRTVWFHAGTIALAVVFSILNMRAQTGALNPGLELESRILVAAFAPAHYLATTFEPIWLSPLHPIESAPGRGRVGMIASAVVLAAALGVFLANWKRCPLVAWGVAASLVSLGPVSGIVGFGAAWAADRYSYIPSLLLLMGLVPAACRALDSANGKLRKGAAWFCLSITCLLTWGTVSYAAKWRDPVTLWTHAREQFPEAPLIRRNLADALSRKAMASQDPAERTRLLAEAARIFPADHRLLMAQAEELEGSGDADALARLLDSARRQPSISDATALWAAAKLGLLRLREGDREEAEREFDTAFARPPQAWPTVQDLLFAGRYAEEAGRVDTARAYYEEALRREPTNGDALEGLAFVLHRQGDLAGALDTLRAAVAATPGDADRARNLAVMEAEAAADVGKQR
ncbi:MAG: tetratricopeptide repeat protein [Candidatus Sumerlaeia bacterium]|nr:tetratricopeptide repeat protein [Candidatus Sumerlaeia bacterium]